MPASSLERHGARAAKRLYPEKPIVLGVVDSESGRWLQNVPRPNGVQPGAVRAGNLAAFGENAHVFVVVNPATPPATDVCADAGFVGTGCVAVFAHTGEERDEDQH